MVLAGLRSEDSIREICRQHGIETKTYYKWKHAFLEGGRQGLSGEDAEPVDNRAKELETEVKRLKELVADLSIENHLLKKATDRWILHPKETTPRFRLMTNSTSFSSSMPVRGRLRRH